MPKVGLGFSIFDENDKWISEFLGKELVKSDEIKTSSLETINQENSDNKQHQSSGAHKTKSSARKKVTFGVIYF